MPQHDFLAVALTFLVAAVVCVPLAARFGLGSVLGYLVAGCLVKVLGIVKDVEAIMHFAEIGVVLMLFVIGLELDRSACGACAARCSAAARCRWLRGALLMVGGMAAGLPWQAALIGGLALALSSTAIAMQTMGERNLLARSAARRSRCCCSRIWRR